MSKKTGGSMLIVGAAGKVGRALFQAMKKHYRIYEHDIVQKVIKGGREKIDLHADPKETSGMVMHICFPYSYKYLELVREYYKTYKPPLIILHSSLPPGTTEKLAEEDIPVVHSPAFVDSNDFRSFPFFHKVVGYDRDDLALDAHEHLRLCFSTYLIRHSRHTELGEAMLGMYFMTNLAIIQEMSRTFEIFGCDYKDMMHMIDVSNAGFIALGKNRHMMPNMESEAIEKDYRLDLINLLPEDKRSAFFKLTIKSNELQKKKEEKLAGIEKIPITI